MTDISYHIYGSDLQYVEVTLPPNRSIIGEQGAMMYMDPNLSVEAVLGDGSAAAFGVAGRLVNAVKRTFSGEALFSSRYRNATTTPQRVAFAVPGVSKIVAVNLADVDGVLVCQRGAYLAGSEDLRIEPAVQKRLRVGFFGGEGFFMQRISGRGIVFIGSSGAQAEMVLQSGEELQVDSGCLVALSASITCEIKYAGRIRTALFGGEGLFYAHLIGPGKVWLQSLPERRLGSRLMSAAFRAQSRRAGQFYLVVIAIVIAIISLLKGH